MPDAPEVVVIIGAYRRREYLLRAVRSVLAQTVDRARFEILVTKDFLDPGIDTELARLGVASIVDEDPRIGTWLGRAIRATTAPLVAFLDDDDEFEPDRLARVLQIFHDHPEIGFYRNRVQVIDAEDRPIPPDRWRGIETDSAFDTSGPVVFAGGSAAGLVPFALRTTRATFNSSTMVLRRSLLVGPWCEPSRGRNCRTSPCSSRRRSGRRDCSSMTDGSPGTGSTVAMSPIRPDGSPKRPGPDSRRPSSPVRSAGPSSRPGSAPKAFTTSGCTGRRPCSTGSTARPLGGTSPAARQSTSDSWGVIRTSGRAASRSGSPQRSASPARVAPGLTRRARAARLHSTATGARPPAGPGPTSPASPGPRGRGAGE